MNIFLYVIELFAIMFKSHTRKNKSKVFKVKVRKSTRILTRWDLQIHNYIEQQYIISDSHFEVCKRIVNIINISINKPLTDDEIKKIEKAVETQYRNKLILDNCVIDFR